MLQKVDPGSRPGPKNHGYFDGLPVPFPISRFDTRKYPWLFEVGPASWIHFLEHKSNSSLFLQSHTGT